MRGTFIVLEGIDGSGKTTQAERLTRHLRDEGHEVVAVEEPGGTDAGERLRAVLLDGRTPLAPLSELCLLASSRHELVREVIRPTLETGAVVISQRFSYSSVAYQGYGRGLDRELIDQLNAHATGGLTPDVALLLDVPLATSRQRRGSRAAPDRFETEDVSFLERVAEGYRALAQQRPEMIRIDADQTTEATFHAVLNALQPEILGQSTSAIEEGGSDGVSM